jgi:ATP synthase subunit 6
MKIFIENYLRKDYNKKKIKMISSPLEQFEIFPLISLRLGSFDLSFTNSSLFMLLSAGLILVLVQLIVVNGNGTLIPTPFQKVLEDLYLLIVSMVYEIVGKKGGEFFAFIFSIFTFILICNLIGLIPYSYTVTSQLIVTFSISLVIWVGKLILGLRLHGLKLFAMFLPAGAPFAMVPFFVFIELIGFVIPLISLSVRLMANLAAGHLLLAVLFGFCWTMMLSGGLLWIAHFIPLTVLFLLFGLETAVAIIQAFVFSLLTCLYCSDVLHGGH